MNLAQKIGPGLLATSVVLAACGNDANAPPTSTQAPVDPQPTLELILQRDWNDCGPAALAMTLNLYGRTTTLDAITQAMPVGADGVSALDIVNLAKQQGLGAMGIRVDRDQAADVLAMGDILHVEGNHFAVFDRISGDNLSLFDPAKGKRQVRPQDFEREFSGIALLFAATPDAMRARRRELGIGH